MEMRDVSSLIRAESSGGAENRESLRAWRGVCIQRHIGSTSMENGRYREESALIRQYLRLTQYVARDPPEIRKVVRVADMPE